METETSCWLARSSRIHRESRERIFLEGEFPVCLFRGAEGCGSPWKELFTVFLGVVPTYYCALEVASPFSVWEESAAVAALMRKRSFTLGLQVR